MRLSIQTEASVPEAMVVSILMTIKTRAHPLRKPNYRPRLYLPNRFEGRLKLLALHRALPNLPT